MVYGDITDVRGLAGIIPEYKHSTKLGTGDGSNVEFELPAVGRNMGYIIDLNGSTTSTIDVNDIVVYVSGTPVTVSSIDEDKGSVILASPPASNAVVTADYKWSEVSDSQILNAMNIATEQVNTIIQGSNVTGNTLTDTFDGDGYTKTFELLKKDIASIDTVTVDGVTQTENTHYYTYKYDNGFYWYVHFETAPRKANKNVKITYTYGSNTFMNDHLSNLLASRIVILKYIKSHRSAGEFVKGKQSRVSARTTRLTEINNQIMEMMKYLDKRKRYELSK